MTHLLNLTTDNISLHSVTAVVPSEESAFEIARQLKGETASVVTMMGKTFVYLSDDSIAEWLQDAYEAEVVRP